MNTIPTFRSSLATVMGHVNVRSTQVYLHTTAAQLHQAARTFHDFVFNPPKEPRK